MKHKKYIIDIIILLTVFSHISSQNETLPLPVQTLQVVKTTNTTTNLSNNSDSTSKDNNTFLATTSVLTASATSLTTTTTAIATTSTTTTTTTTTPRPKKKLRIVALLDFYSDFDFNTYESSAETARELINSNPNILPDHEIEFIKKDSGGRPGFSFVQLYSAILNEGPIHGVIGPANSRAMLLTGPLLKDLGLLQMSFAALEEQLGSRTNFPNLFRSNPSLDAYTSSVIALFNRNKWKKVAILYDFTNLIFLQTALDLQQLLRQINVDVELFESLDPDQLGEDLNKKNIIWDNHYLDLISKVSLIKENDIRIIIGIFTPSIARHIFCEAYKLKLFGERYSWIIPNGNAYQNWTTDDKPTYECTNADIQQAAQGLLLFRTGPKRVDGQMTVAGMTADDIWAIVRDRKLKICELARQNRQPNCYVIFNALYCYDAVWALALAFDKALKTIPGFTIENYNRSDGVTTKKLAYIMDRLEFEGVSGFYSYKEVQGDNRVRTAEMVLTVFNEFSPYTRDSDYLHYGVIGFSDGIKGEVSINETLQRLIMPNYTVPRDGPLIMAPAEQFHVGVIIFAWVYSGIGAILAILFLFVNVYYRKKLLIKMSSPNINNVIIIGCLFCYVSVFLYGLDSRIISPDKIPMSCNVIVIFLMIGFTLAFGSLFSKTWRIYRIFYTARTLHKTGIRDLHLFVVVFAMLVIDAVIIIAWMVLSPYELSNQYLKPEVNLELDLIIRPIIHRCTCHYQDTFTAVTYVYKAILLLFGLFVAWETKNIKVTVLNDSKYIGASVYIVALFSSIAAVATHSLAATTSFEASYIVFAICICTCTTVTLCFVFIPKLVLLRKNFEDPNFKNGRPVVDGEDFGVYTSSRSSVFAPSFSESEQRSGIYREVRANTNATQDSSITNGSLNDINLPMVPENGVIENLFPGETKSNFKYRNTLGSGSSSNSSRSRSMSLQNNSFTNFYTDVYGDDDDVIQTRSADDASNFSKSFPSKVNNNESVFHFQNGSSSFVGRRGRVFSFENHNFAD